ncbi:hypothetical protein [Pseudacidovorax intermedius]|uniref:Uncharacterized protein n=1 Tax=Pseudacidovorax intermedius TaxID=433924 RepID=A0A147GWJ8_9BURK|nr:hypothetical protein [Pseudacidovorax intermedius]KTT21890.1 hypothetical protein NS331_11040 [Pseudacidovorax intermedius]
MSAPDELDRRQELILLGRIHGLVESLKTGQDVTNMRIDDLAKRFDARLDGIDARLRTVEQRAAVAGAVSGGAMAVGTALILEGLKMWLRGSGGGGGPFLGP